MSHIDCDRAELEVDIGVSAVVSHGREERLRFGTGPRTQPEELIGTMFPAFAGSYVEGGASGGSREEELGCLRKYRYRL